MSFVVWIVALFVSAWTSSARLVDFVHAIDVCIALGLAYSILLKVGNFSGTSLDTWVVREKARVVGPLAEDKDFDAEGYVLSIDKCRTRFQRFVFLANLFFMAWCVFAAFAALAALILIPFHTSYVVSGSVVLENAFLLAAPVPLGVLTLVVTHIGARFRIRHHSRDADGHIRILARKKAKDLAAARAAIGQVGPTRWIDQAGDWIEAHRLDIKLWALRIIWTAIAAIAIHWFLTH